VITHFGIAMITSTAYANRLGWVTIVAGVAGLAAGFMDSLLGLTTASTFVLFPISSGLFTLIVLYIGVLLLRRASASPRGEGTG